MVEVVASAAAFAEDLVVFDTEEAPRANADDAVRMMWRRCGMRWCWVRGIMCGSVDFSKVLVGLSGGIDSALVAAIAVEALGAENVLGIGMPSEYSSLGSIEDAKAAGEESGDSVRAASDP